MDRMMIIDKRLALAIVLSCVGVAAAEETLRLESDHFVIKAVAGTEPETLEMAVSRGEAYYEAIHEILGYEPKAKVIVQLRGDAEQPDGSWGYPRVDSFGQIHLYKFTQEPESYFNALAHELVHVFRFRRSTGTDWFFEEGFAEFVARRVSSSLDGFPWYGYPVDLVAGQWLASGDDVPLELLRTRHRDLNLPCKLQSYSMRASFFLYLAEAHGTDRLLEMSNQKPAGEPSQYEEFFGADFATLEARWRAHALEKYSALEKADILAKQYRTQSPAQYSNVCQEGEDF